MAMEINTPSRLACILKRLIREGEEDRKKKTTITITIMRTMTMTPTTMMAAYEENQNTNTIEKKKRKSPMSTLPCYLVMDIFCKLPIRSLIFCKSVFSTAECMTLPKIRMVQTHLSVCGFGFSSKTNQYKVMRILYQGICDPSGRVLSFKWVVEIYTLGNMGTGTWRDIGYAPYYFPYNLSGVFLNEALHWIAHDDNSSKLICAFDIGNEQFKTIPLPPISFSEQGRAIDWSNLGVLGGCLYIYAGEKDVPQFVEIWVMKEYGVKESWTKELVIKDLKGSGGVQISGFN
ncbi:hypothetical protein L1049_020722 [Liquidambar formosana]|uniref:F-box associated beta-propeller type 3 domain-containing protein n=1 Tax=Liquidambar formosana TaxID=63359 RepID=A0AAP0SD52_LIQFO